MLNDIMTINENKICYVSSAIDKEKIYIIILQLYKNDEILITRYYIIDIYGLYNYKLYSELQISLYNKFVSMSFSDFDANDNHYTEVIIFSYPNSVDFDLDLINQLTETNENITGLI